jgi:hypothetical protein
MNRNLSVPINLVCTLCLAALARPGVAGGVSGAIFTTTVNGSAVNANHYESKCAVYLDGGPGPHALANAAGLPDGDYDFQVTDPSGGQLLSTDAVSNRRFHVTAGIITSFTGTGGPVHPTGVDQDHSAQGAITIGLANASCPNDFLNTPSAGNVYKAWVTPVASFNGNPANVDNPCGGGCSHGFVRSQSKTDNFMVQAAPSATFCLTIQKQFSLGGVTSLDTLGGWGMTVIDPAGTLLGGITTTGANGDTATVCQLGAGTYTVIEATSGPAPTGCGGLLPNGTTIPQVLLNGNPLSAGSAVTTFTWDATQPANITVSFVNTLGCAG